MASEQSSLPATHRALVLRSAKEPLDMAVEERPTPQPTSGSAVVRVMAAAVLSYAREVYNGKRNYPFPLPFVPGSSGVGRIVAVGPDAALLRPGQLVLIDSFIRGRDDAAARCLSGLSEGVNEGGRTLMHGEWRDSTYAEYVKMPLENLYPLDEKRLLGSPSEGGLGYDVEDLVYIPTMLVPFGGLRDVDFKVGEKVVVAPATGTFGGSAVPLAIAMGAREVVAMGRNKEALEKLKSFSPRIRTVPIIGDWEAETKSLRENGPADVYFDISPPGSANSTHFKAGILSLGQDGRASLMGGQWTDVLFPSRAVTTYNLKLHGKWMYEVEDVKAMIKLVEGGMLKLGVAGGFKEAERYPLEEFNAAFDAAAAKNGLGFQTVIVP
ncbi:alcohol dehydrogenase [Xylariomycetidae sp. FL2044]|nr:alcohol dehydrogenase [Xylariomycetidae sp. FL2044]